MRRVSAAVVVNDRSVTEGAGKSEHMVWKPRSAEEMHRLEELAQAAVGYDARRETRWDAERELQHQCSGDEAAGDGQADGGARGLLRTQPELMRTVVIGLCGVLLVLFVLRPVARQVTATLREPRC